MGTSKSIHGRDLHLTAEHLIQLLADAAFYRQCPVFLFLEETGRAAVIEYMSAMARRTAGQRPQPTPEQLILPAVSAVVRHLVKLHDVDPSLLLPVREFICRKLSWRPRSLILYYTCNGSKRRLAF